MEVIMDEYLTPFGINIIYLSPTWLGIRYKTEGQSPRT